MRDVAVFVIVLFFFVRLGRKAELWVRPDETLKTTAALLERPVTSSLLVTIMILGDWFQSTAPNAYLNLLGLVLLLIMLRLLPHASPGIRPSSTSMGHRCRQPVRPMAMTRARSHLEPGDVRVSVQ